jgi:hypothetical protein
LTQLQHSGEGAPLPPPLPPTPVEPVPGPLKHFDTVSQFTWLSQAHCITWGSVPSQNDGHSTPAKPQLWRTLQNDSHEQLDPLEVDIVPVELTVTEFVPVTLVVVVVVVVDPIPPEPPPPSTTTFPPQAIPTISALARPASERNLMPHPLPAPRRAQVERWDHEAGAGAPLHVAPLATIAITTASV